MYTFYADFVDSCQTQWEESQTLWKKEMNRWQQMGQNCLDDITGQFPQPFHQDWCSQAFKDYETFWKKSLELMGPWPLMPDGFGLGNASEQFTEVSQDVDQLKNLQSGHKKKITELSRQLTLLKKDMTAQKQLAKSQAVELEALKDNLGLQEKAMAALESRLKTVEKPQSTQ